MKQLCRVLAFAALLGALPIHASTFPDRPLRIVVPFAAGGNVDIVTRIVAGGLSEALGQSVVVENKAGANGVIGAEFVARSAADGYTLFIATAETMALNPFLMKSVPYDPLKDFAAIGLIDDFPFTLTVNPQLPVKTVSEFVAYARANQGKLNFSSWGTGSIGQIAFEQFNQATGIRMEHIPFKGAAPAIMAVATGEVHAFMATLSVARPQAASGRVRILAITTAERDPTAPEIPTLREMGVDVVIRGWHILAAPAATPASVVSRLNGALVTTVRRPDISEKLIGVGVRPVTSSADEAHATIRSENVRWRDVARKAGLKAE
ncbi:MAG: tripartite tricarboxylate transporter substrate binding protein [Betaproteobacteria bacterium]|nr:tripartite tricarboxylate transporter substrate binding protein [Betaproteobacteria bacterium]